MRHGKAQAIHESTTFSIYNAYFPENSRDLKFFLTRCDSSLSTMIDRPLSEDGACSWLIENCRES